MRIDFQTDPSRYRHWRIEVEGALANLIMDVDETAGLFEGYELKLNSYDLGVDIELHDAMQRLRFEHPEVRAVVLRSAKERVFCAGANIRMLAGASHAHKVNFCKFTNETRNAMEDASAHSGQRYIAAVNGACAGGGYELALACDYIILTDDGSSSVSLPEVALLAVLPGTGGITRVTDKRKVRRDRADIFCATEEGVRGQRALDWRLVDEVAPPSRFAAVVTARAEASAAVSDRPVGAAGIRLGPLDRKAAENTISYSSLEVEIDRAARLATITIAGPSATKAGDAVPADTAEMAGHGDRFWPLRLARELDDALLHLRFNELEIAVIAFKTSGDPAAVLAHDTFLAANQGDWLAREIILFWTRVIKRVDLTSRSLVALIEPGSCFAGFLAELAFAADRSFIAEGAFEGDNRADAALLLSAANFGRHPMCNGLSRLATRFLGEPETLEVLAGRTGQRLEAGEAEALGLVTAALDDIDWDDEVRLFLQERASFSPDALTGLEANTRFAGPETMETKIFGRLTAWQNWIFQRANAVGETGALGRYGSGQPAVFDRRRV
ncbi:MAG: 2,3-epoxybenzoyl-CoA dihydrolase [Proteobacteria bacterium]|nr:2,3-epoxybenzoyl-CoA dihydrolase [Pseudomonadota bacterium]